MTSRHLAATALATLLPAVAAHAQVVFLQDFSGGTTPAAFVASPATGNLFDGILPAGDAAFSIVNGALNVNRTTNASLAVNRVTDLPGVAGGAATYQFNFNLLSVTSAATGNNDIIFQVGSGYTNVTGAETASTYAQFTIDVQAGGANGQYSIGGQTFTGNHNLYLALNNSGAPVTFTTPAGTSLTLANDNFALYVDQTALSTGFPVNVTGGTATQDITDFKLRFALNDLFSASVDNFTVTAIPEPSTWTLLGVLGVRECAASSRAAGRLFKPVVKRVKDPRKELSR